MNFIKKILLTIVTLLIIISLSFTLIGCPQAPKEEVEETTPEEITTTEKETTTEETTVEEEVQMIMTQIVFVSNRNDNDGNNTFNTDIYYESRRLLCYTINN